MEDALLFFQIGWQHIISWEAIDHLLFLSALIAIYQWNDWKKVLVLITAFTIGHSITLVLSITDILRFSSNWVEFFIPLTIVITAIGNGLHAAEKGNSMLPYRYLLTLIFGLIHGMGFASTLRFMLAEGESITIPMISFNLGIEAGQILVVMLLLIINYVAIDIYHINRRIWSWGLSAAAGLSALVFCILRSPF